MKRFMFTLALLLASAVLVSAEPLDAAQKAKVQAKLAALQVWGSDAEVLKLFKALTAAPPAWADGMTQDKWKALGVLSAEVKDISRNELAALLKKKKDDSVSEIFVSNAEGTKVAFMAKTTNWSHKGKPKHEVPMTGKAWIGEIEVDESTGQKQVQVAFPVLDGGKVIGSIVVGLQLAKL